jgi:hypothetical protein
MATGASLPDRGDVRLFGRSTSAIADSADWLSVVDRFGIVSSRAVLLDALTVVQNLAMPFTLEVDPLLRTCANGPWLWPRMWGCHTRSTIGRSESWTPAVVFASASAARSRSILRSSCSSIPRLSCPGRTSPWWLPGAATSPPRGRRQPLP